MPADISLANVKDGIGDSQRLRMLIEWLQTRPGYVTYGTSADLASYLMELEVLRASQGERRQVNALCVELKQARAALAAYRTAQRDLKLKWAEGGWREQEKLWRALHACEHEASALLAGETA